MEVVSKHKETFFWFRKKIFTKYMEITKEKELEKYGNHTFSIEFYTLSFYLCSEHQRIASI